MTSLTEIIAIYQNAMKLYDKCQCVYLPG